MISYCSEEHKLSDLQNHNSLCSVIQELAKKRGGHIYNMAKKLTDHEYRNIRVHTLNLCQNMLERSLQPFEREIILFPRICYDSTCREWHPELLVECKDCKQVTRKFFIMLLEKFLIYYFKFRYHIVKSIPTICSLPIRNGVKPSYYTNN